MHNTFLLFLRRPACGTSEGEREEGRKQIEMKRNWEDGWEEEREEEAVLIRRVNVVSWGSDTKPGQTETPG